MSANVETPSNVVAFPSISDALIPDGVYQVAFDRFDMTTRFNRGSLEIWFKVLDYGEHFGQIVPRYYKVELVSRGKERARTFRVSRHSAFAREFGAIFRMAPPAGVAAINCYRDTALLAKIRKATTDHRQRELPEALQYNVIDELVGRAER